MYVYSNLRSDNAYTFKVKKNGVTTERKIVIYGYVLPLGNRITTALGVETEISSADLELLRSHPIFVLQEENKFISVSDVKAAKTDYATSDTGFNNPDKGNGLATGGIIPGGSPSLGGDYEERFKALEDKIKSLNITDGNVAIDLSSFLTKDDIKTVAQDVASAAEQQVAAATKAAEDAAKKSSEVTKAAEQVSSAAASAAAAKTSTDAAKTEAQKQASDAASAKAAAEQQAAAAAAAKLAADNAKTTAEQQAAAAAAAAKLAADTAKTTAEQQAAAQAAAATATAAVEAAKVEAARLEALARSLEQGGAGNSDDYEF